MLAATEAAQGPSDSNAAAAEEAQHQSPHDPNPNKANSLRKLLIIGPGFGGGAAGAKYKYLTAHGGFETHLAELPEPTDGEEDTWSDGVTLLAEMIKLQKPDILVASSRGGKYAAEVSSIQ